MAAAEYGWIFVEVSAAASVNTDLAFVHLTARAKAAAANLLKQQQQQSASSSALPPASATERVPLQKPHSSQPLTQSVPAASVNAAAAESVVSASVPPSAATPISAASASQQMTPNPSATMTAAGASASAPSASAADMDLQILERELQQISTALENGTYPGVLGWTFQAQNSN
jgi:hypothetical protein